MKKFLSPSNLHSNNLRNSRAASKSCLHSNNLRNSRAASKSCLHSNNLRNLRNLREIIYILAICGSLILCSCARTRYIPLPSSHSRDSLSKSVNVLVNTTYVDRTHTLTQRGDTIFKTDSIYVEKYTDVEVHDTIIVTQRDSIPYPVEVPVEVPTPIPRVYRYSLWFVILFLLYWLFRIAKAVYLRR